MNSEQVFSVIRQVLLFGGGFIVSKGWVDDATLTIMIGGLIAFLSGAWAIYTRRNTALVAAAANVPSTQQIVTSSQTIANNSPTNVVLAK